MTSLAAHLRRDDRQHEVHTQLTRCRTRAVEYEAGVLQITGVHCLRRVQRCRGYSAMSSLGGDCTPLAAHRRRRLNERPCTHPFVTATRERLIVTCMFDAVVHRLGSLRLTQQSVLRRKDAMVTR